MQQQQQQSGFGSVGGGVSINDKRPRLERAVSYDRESSNVGVSAGFGHHHRTSSTSSVDPSPILRSGSSLAGGQPSSALYQNPQQQQQQLQTRGQLQRSGSLQSHGTSSWRNNVPPHQISSDLMDNSPARGKKKKENVFARSHLFFPFNLSFVWSPLPPLFFGFVIVSLVDDVFN